MKIHTLNCSNCGGKLKETKGFCRYVCENCNTISVLSNDFNTLPGNEYVNQMAKNEPVGKGAETKSTSSNAPVDRSARKQAEAYIKAADAGCADAQYSIGRCYYNGVGVEEDVILALKYFKMAAQQENRESLIYIITILEKQLSVLYNLPKNKKQRHIQLEDWNLENIDIEQLESDVYHHLDLWANRDRNAYFELGATYFFGSELLARNQLRAFKMFEKSAELGKLEAQVMLGYFYEHGVPLLSIKKEIMPNIDHAIEIYENVDHPVAHYLLGCFYLFEYSKKTQDFKKAGEYFLQAAEKNEILSTAILRNAYDREIILNKDKVIATFETVCKHRKYKKRKLKNKPPVYLWTTLLLMKELGIIEQSKCEKCGYDIDNDCHCKKCYEKYDIVHDKRYTWWLSDLNLTDQRLLSSMWDCVVLKSHNMLNLNINELNTGNGAYYSYLTSDYIVVLPDYETWYDVLNRKDNKCFYKSKNYTKYVTK
jgi:TPR repeat protein